MTHTPSYKYATAHEWLEKRSQGWSESYLRSELMKLAYKLDSDQLQDEYQELMDEDGYFDPIETGE